MKLTTPKVHAQWLRHGTAALQATDTPALAAARAWVDDVPRRWLLVLASNTTGSGKSLAAAWAQRRLEELADQPDPRVVAATLRGKGSWWINAAALAGLRGMREWERLERLHRCRDAWLLVVDDMGAEPADLAGELQSILEVRHAEQRLTLCTTNLVGPDGRATAEWKSRYDRRFASRMAVVGDHERGALSSWVHCTGPDLRGRCEPAIIEPAKGEATFDLDAIVGPVLRATAPAELDRRAIERERVARDASRAAADAARHKVWGGIALRVLAEAAEQGDERAFDFLDTVARRAKGATDATANELQQDDRADEGPHQDGHPPGRLAAREAGDGDHRDREGDGPQARRAAGGAARHRGGGRAARAAR